MDSHGLGRVNPNLAAAVSEVELVSTDSELRPYTRDDDPNSFPEMTVSRRALGVLTWVALDVVVPYDGTRPWMLGTRHAWILVIRVDRSPAPMVLKH